jgi:hypothetical protein
LGPLILVFEKLAIVVIVRQGSVDVSHGELWEFGNHLFGSQALKVMPNMDVPHSDARSRDARLAATYSNVSGNVTPFDDLVPSGVHTLIQSSH